jgi:hypothetical protein
MESGTRERIMLQLSQHLLLAGAAAFHIRQFSALAFWKYPVQISAKIPDKVLLAVS